LNRHLSPELAERARELVALYPHPRSALIPICHLAQEQDGWLSPEAVAEIAQMVGLEPAEVVGTASFYEMLRTEPVGKYVISVCTNIACMLRGAYGLLGHAQEVLGACPGSTSDDGMFTLEDVECIADCGRAPCLAVNHRFFGDVTNEIFDSLVDDLRAGRLGAQVPPHGTLVRVRREGGLRVDEATISSERLAAAEPAPDRAAAPATERAAKPTAKRAATPTPERAAKPTTERAAKPTAKRAATPTPERAAKPTAKRAAKRANKRANKRGRGPGAASGGGA
jgi:NADH-quinone oxidoreductase E subunit